MLEIKKQGGPSKTTHYKVAIFINGILNSEETILPFEDEKELEFISRVASEIAMFNLEPANKVANTEKRLITK